MAAVGPSHRSATRVSMSLQGGAVAQSASGTVLGKLRAKLSHNILLITQYAHMLFQQLRQHLSISHPIFLKMFNLIDQSDMEHLVLFGEFHFSQYLFFAHTLCVTLFLCVAFFANELINSFPIIATHSCDNASCNVVFKL